MLSRVAAGIARTFQLTHLFRDLTARENVRIAAQARHPDRWRPIAGGQVFAASQKAANEALEQMRLTAFADTKAGLLSHGQKQWLEIGMLLAQEPKLLLVDEPVAGTSGKCAVGGPVGT